jgi:hypothetical protein
MSTNLSLNPNLNELENNFSKEIRRSKSYENKQVEMTFERKSDGCSQMNSDKGDESEEEASPEESSSKNNLGNLTTDVPSKNSLLNTLKNETPKNIEKIDNVVFSFMGNSKTPMLIEPPQIKFQNPIVNITPTLDQISDHHLNEAETKNDHLSIEKLSKKHNLKSMSSEFSYGNFSVDAIENKIKDFENINPLESKENEQERVQILERINEEGEEYKPQKYSKSLSGSVYGKSAERNDDSPHVRYSNKEESGSSRNFIENNSFSVKTPQKSKINTNPVEPFQIYLEEGDIDPNIHSTKSNPDKEEKVLSPKLFSKVDYDYSQSVGNDKLRKLVPENNSIKTTTQYSIFESKRQLSNSIGADSSFKESEFEVKMKPNLLIRTIDSPQVINESRQNETESESSKKSETPKFSKLEELMLTKDENEMSFTKQENEGKDMKEVQFKKTVEELEMDSITMQTQSLDQQGSLITDLIKSKKSSKEDEEIRSRITEFDIIKNFEKFDPQGSLLKKLIVKYKILTSKI